MNEIALVAKQKEAATLRSTAAENRIHTRNAQNSFAESFDQIAAVLMRDLTSGAVLTDLEWLVLPPLTVGQFEVAHTLMQPSAKASKNDNAQEGGVLVPVAVALWARVSANIHKVLLENLDKQPRLQPADWTSGNNLWLMAVAGDQRAVPKFLEQLVEKDFKGRQVWMRMRARDGKVVVKTLATRMTVTKPRGS